MGKKLDLVGVAEIAQLLGVSRQRVHQLLRDRPDFPESVAELVAGRIWLRTEVLTWAETWDRRPGRRATI
jgi:predicted DNA-binding transcriptional regulator AlpA